MTSGARSTSSAVPTIDVTELARQRASGAVLIDVRQPAEYAEAHVPGAVLLPLDQLADRLGDVPQSGAVYVICRTGGRSQMGAQFLLQHGVDAINVTGGTLAWIDAGHQVATGADA